jgi:serine/threonine protein kinase
MPKTSSQKLSNFRTGTQFLQYQLLEGIGAGGQGFVWSAIDQSQNRIVAIKFSEIPIPEEQTIHDATFEQQGKRLFLLRHPNILPLYDFGTLQGLYYLVSLYIPGGSLHDWLNAARLSMNVSLTIAADIAAALDYLHGQGIIHRDLKPANVLVDFNRKIYVADFGLARILSDSTQAMHTGHGTPPYSPPEQHSFQGITAQSDIYSFGVMLYQLFTGHIPWNGEKTLGIQQLYSDDEIPDPREYNPDLPEGLVKTLRQITAAKPAARPRTASDVMLMLYDVLHTPPIQADITSIKEPTPFSPGADELLKFSMNRWEPSSGTIPMSLTKFALVDLVQKQNNGNDVPENIRNFMLQSSLAYGYNADFWWKKVELPGERLRICEGLFSRNNESITTRVLTTLLRDPAMRTMKATLPPSVTEAVISLAGSTKTETLRQDLLEFLRLLVPPPKNWQASTLGVQNDTALAKIASEDSPTGDQAARLIGVLHSTSAVSALFTLAGLERRKAALLLIQESAGSLPSAVLASTRLSLAGELFANRLTANPGALLQIYGLSALGAALATGLQVYLTYRLPNFMDLTRISISLERGLFMGLLFGFGIFITRLLSGLLPITNRFQRAAIATIAGSFALTTSLLLYDLIFLNTLPGGILFILGCSLISACYAFGELIRNKLIRILSTLAIIFATLAATWYGHILLGVAPFEVSPIFYYEYSWPTVQILTTMLAVSLPMAVFGHLGKLPQE